ncbi:MAG: hypothetical protein AAB874_01660 [Patescibacteria group bacterium]
MPSDKELKRKLTELLSQVHLRSAWIGNVLRTNLTPPRPDATVCCLNVGSGEELLQVRKFIGDQARLYAVDIKSSPNLSLMCIGANAEFISADISYVADLTGHMSSVPDIVISRHPRIVVTVNKQGQPGEVDTSWFQPLSEWGQLVVGNGGQMLITTYTQVERDVLGLAMGKFGLNPEQGENDFAPSSLVRKFGPALAGPDKFTLVLR